MQKMFHLISKWCHDDVTVLGTWTLITGREGAIAAADTGTCAKDNGDIIWGTTVALPPFTWVRPTNCDGFNIVGIWVGASPPADNVANWGCNITLPLGRVRIQVIGEDRKFMGQVAAELLPVAAINCEMGREAVAESGEDAIFVAPSVGGTIDGFIATVVMIGASSVGLGWMGELAVWAEFCLSFFLHFALLFWNHTCTGQKEKCHF